VTVGLKRVKLL